MVESSVSVVNIGVLYTVGPSLLKKTVTRGRDTSLYKLYRFLLPHRVGFLRRFGLKTGIRFAHFGQGSGMVFEGTTDWI